MKISKSFITILVMIILVIILIANGLFQLSKARTYQVFGEIIPRVETDEKIIALTFDDGPTEYTEEVLKTLQEKEVKATFYVIGTELQSLPDIGKNIISQGHELGNHSYTHQRFYLKSQSFIAEEVEKTNKLIKEAGHTKEITFRPPNGKKLFGLPWYLSKHNIKTIMWDVEPDTFVNSQALEEDRVEFLVNNTLENIKSGSIILLHPNCEKECAADRKALPQIIDQLKAKGYTFVTISVLLEYHKSD